MLDTVIVVALARFPDNSKLSLRSKTYINLVREPNVVLVLLIRIAIEHNPSVVDTVAGSSFINPAFPTGYTLVIVKSSHSSFDRSTTNVKP